MREKLTEHMRLTFSANAKRLLLCSEDLYEKKAGVIAIDQLIDLKASSKNAIGV